jgi:hypothetical protein
MTEEFRKEAYRLFWLVKGHLGCHYWTDKSIEEMHDSYFKRLWCKYQGDDMSRIEDGFEEAYQKLFENGKQTLDKDKEILYNKATH